MRRRACTWSRRSSNAAAIASTPSSCARASPSRSGCRTCAWVCRARCNRVSPTSCTWAKRSPRRITSAWAGPVPPTETEVTEDALQAFNRPEFREAGIPGGGGTMTAAELALFYQALLTGRAHDGREVWSPDTLTHGQARANRRDAGRAQRTAREPRARRDHRRRRQAHLPRVRAHHSEFAFATAEQVDNSPGPIPRPASRSATARTASTATRSGPENGRWDQQPRGELRELTLLHCALETRE